MSISKSIRIALAAATTAALLSACSSTTETPSPEPSTEQSVSESPAASDSASPEPSASPSVSVEPSTDLGAITVTDTDKPEVQFAAPWAISSTTTKVLRPSANPQHLTQDSVVKLNYVGVNGTTGEIFDTSYDSSPKVFPLSNVVPGFRLGLDKQAVGSRVLIGMPASDGYPQGNQSGSIKPGDSLLFVVDIISANFEGAMGEEQPPVEGMPQVSVGTDGPSVSLDTAKQPPEQLQVAPLIKGSGQPVTAESLLQVKYRSWVWSSGEQFEDSWAPQSGRLSGLIEGWKQGLVGQTAGSRVLLVVPPALAYPEGRSTSPALQPGQTLVYVIDILDVQ
ncbi:FKBP-type peptidyl-prolyl cis-trans isomerase [Tessaracoccus sp. OH4464_COT-324]|uniref:FKBP-type peptidyl-prolyl cis-trans isomerase n=1 Tax=Tessaracoccus sp. OH4464_COT-324 TaxID=2491059 RepID=UPI00131A1D0B|nr:FKBP-type peptidyl-prolyl cis-trans isomerase [Tessaracoccus sp. OH4464_COT-324]